MARCIVNGNKGVGSKKCILDILSCYIGDYCVFDLGLSKKAKRIREKSNVEGSRLFINLLHEPAISSKFAALIGIQLNTYPIVAAGISLIVPLNGIVVGLLNIYQETVIEIHNLHLPSERFGWSFVCKSIIGQSSEDFVGLIVDSDLKRIPFINRREEPIQDNFYLPDRFELLYASSDPGDRYIANDLLKLCDRNTREVAKLVASTQTLSLPPLLKADPGDPFTHIRVWNHTEQK